MYNSDAADGGREAAGEYAPTPVAVIAALKRLLDSEELRSSVRSRDFLAYVVSETLAGRADRLKERTVARYALGRGGDFDPRTNPTARVQAIRLRAAMARYYAGQGSEEPLVIELPKGSYVPRFFYSERPRAVGRAEPLRPGVAVAQFADLRAEGHRDQASVALSDSLVRSLSAFPDLRIIGPVVAERGVAAPVDAPAIAREFDVEYVLAGSVRSTVDTLRLTIRVYDGASGRVLWSEHFDQDQAGLHGFRDEDRLVTRIAATVGDVRGVVRREVERHQVGEDDPGTEVRAAVLAFYRFADSGSRRDTETAASRLLTALEVEPRNVVLLSMAGWVHCLQGIMHWTPDPDESIALAERLAGNALMLDPASAQAHQVLAGVALYRGLDEQCRHHALRTVQLNPANASLLYTSGVLLLRTGDWDGGIEMIREANRLNPYHPGYNHVFLGMDRLFAGDNAGALAEMSLLHQPDDVWGPLLRALALAGLGMDEPAARELDTALAMEPGLLDNDAAFITDSLLDAPEEARVQLRRRLLDWTRSRAVSPAQAD
ncbi:hypothetical protein GA707_11030 [Nostocoides sp. F2B08]|uniref:tetratricopeptide repeat protein n=1 Tax=Nostocoides sp. F2B08 TaxID=2653936 RepID=UPI0012631188|nr:hypothetical protein [Tetrasphaera sp. F2B08]KAB7743992.1 hypothetical protein GA707_11030 [Tetrasphaera sp. F2B08]